MSPDSRSPSANLPSRRRPQVSAEDMEERLGSLGMDPRQAIARARSQSRVGRKRTRSEARDADMADGAGEDGGDKKKRVHSKPSRSMSRGRSLSMAAPKTGSGLKDAEMRNKAVRMADKAQYRMNKFAKQGEADRHIGTKMPKHLFSGKRGIGKTDRR